MIYNDAYTKTVELIGEHPEQFGKPASLGWGDVSFFFHLNSQTPSYICRRTLS
jgi:hypothetical protein